MEDRETKHIAQTVVDTFWDPVPIGALEQAKALSKCIFALTVRRVFRSHPVPEEVTLAESAPLEPDPPSTVSNARASVASNAAVAFVASPARSLAAPSLGIVLRARWQHAFPAPVWFGRGDFDRVGAIAAVASPMRGRATGLQPHARQHVQAVSSSPAGLRTHSLRTAGA